MVYIERAHDRMPREVLKTLSLTVFFHYFNLTHFSTVINLVNLYLCICVLCNGITNHLYQNLIDSLAVFEFNLIFFFLNKLSRFSCFKKTCNICQRSSVPCVPPTIRTQHAPMSKVCMENQRILGQKQKCTQVRLVLFLVFLTCSN